MELFTHTVPAYGRNISDSTRVPHEPGHDDGPEAGTQFFPRVYDELRRLAAAQMARETPGQTMQATALVHEAWLRLGAAHQPHWRSRAHFFGAAAEAMRRILVDRARKKARMRHGGGLERVDSENVTVAAEDGDPTVLAIDDALETLAAESEAKAEIVKLRYFAGMEHAEIAEVLGLSEPTMRRRWAYV